MALQKCKSIFFTENVRIGRSQVMAQGQSPTRISLVDDKRYEVFVDVGIEAIVHDKELDTRLHVAWGCVRDWELVEEAAKADAAVRAKVAAQSAQNEAAAPKNEKQKAPVMA